MTKIHDIAYGARQRAEVDAGRAIFCARCASATADLVVTCALASWQQAG